jgi:hypothetical protein
MEFFLRFGAGCSGLCLGDRSRGWGAPDALPFWGIEAMLLD